MSLSVRLLRLLGADPVVFRPLYRMQELLLDPDRRGAEQILRRVWSPSFRRACFGAALLGLLSAWFLLLPGRPPLGYAYFLVLGCGLLFVTVIGDTFDVLTDPRDALVLAGQPHDDRSFLLAKIAPTVRAVAILGAILFLPPAVAAGIGLRSSAVFFASLAGTMAAGAATAALGILFAAALLRIGGRSVQVRVTSWCQGLFLIGWLAWAPSGDFGSRVWTFPVFWFLAPLEFAAGGGGATAGIRLGLALATLALLLAGVAGWLTGLTERLREPVREERRPRTAATLCRKREAAIGERKVLFAIQRSHLRSDWQFQTHWVLVWLLSLGLFSSLDMLPESWIRFMIPFFFSIIAVSSADVLTRSHRPEALSCVLTAPVDRVRFSLASISLLRVFYLAPLFAVAAVVQVWTGGATLHSLALLLELLALGDLLILLGRAVSPAFPFSRRTWGEKTAGEPGGWVATGVGTGLVLLSGLWGTPGYLAGAALFALLRFPAARLARRRIAEAATRAELASFKNDLAWGSS